MMSPAEPRRDSQDDTLGGTDAAPHSTGSSPAPTRQVGRFTIEGELGRGGFGVVFRGFDPVLGRTCAVKVLRGDGAGSMSERESHARERLLREARAVARLGKHANIVQVHEAGVTPEGYTYIAMELVEGESLDRIVARRSVGWREAADIARRVALGLAHAHKHGIIHRDVKPQNVILDERGEPQLTDFGIAKDLESGSVSLTREGSTLGTPAFMSPEQAQALPIDARSDVYSVGALLHAIVRGKPPFAAPHVAMVLRQVIEDEPPRLDLRQLQCPRDLETVLLKAMQKEPAGRYASAEELALDLARVLAGEAPRARRPGLFTELVRRARRSPRSVAIVLALAVLSFAVYRLRSTGAEERRVYQVLSHIETIGSPDEQLKLCDDAIRTFPSSWQPYYQRGRIELEIGRRAVLADEAAALAAYREAEASLTRAIELNAKATSAYFWRGVVRCEALEDYDDGEQDLLKSAADDPRNPIRRVYDSVSRGSPPRAEDLVALEVEMAKQPRLAVIFELRSGARLLRHEFPAALADADAAVATAPLSARAHACRAAALLGVGRLPEALAAADRSVSIAPRCRYGYETRAQVRAAMGARSAAVADLDAAIALLPKESPIRKRDEQAKSSIVSGGGADPRGRQ